MKLHISFKHLKKSFRRIAVSALAVIMMSGQIDPAGVLAIRALAAEAADPDKTVIDPLGLDRSVREQVLPMGSKEEDIYFPSSITADVLEKKEAEPPAPAAGGAGGGSGASAGSEKPEVQEASEGKEAAEGMESEEGKDAAEGTESEEGKDAAEGTESEEGKDAAEGTESEEGKDAAEGTETGEAAESGSGNETGEGAETGSGNETGEGTETGSGNETGEGAESGSGNETGEGAESGSGNETGEGAETGSGNETGEGAESGSGNETGEGAESGSGNETGEGAETGSGNETGEGAESGSGSTGDSGSTASEDSGSGRDSGSGSDSASGSDEGQEAEASAKLSVPGFLAAWLNDGVFTLTTYAMEPETVTSTASNAEGTGSTESLTDPEQDPDYDPVVGGTPLDDMENIPVEYWKINVSKSSESKFRSDRPGLKFVYEPVLSGKYRLASGAELPSITVTISEGGAKLLPVKMLEGAEDLDPEYAWVGFGTTDVTLDEKGRYIVTLYRAGNTEEAAEVVLNTMDFSAAYGKDYRFDDDRYEVTVFEQTQTISERSGQTLNGKVNDDYIGESIEEAAEKTAERNRENGTEIQVPDELKGYVDANGNIPYNTLNWVASGRTFEHETEEEADPSEKTGEDDEDEESAGEPEGDAAKLQDYMSLFEGGRLATASNYMEYLMPADHATASDAETEAAKTKKATASDADDPHSLAALKRAQTGLPTRDTFESELAKDYVPELQRLLEEMLPQQLSELYLFSAETTIVFEPGETEKQIIFEVLEDKEAEDTEAFRLSLMDSGDNTRLHSADNISVYIKDDEPYEYSSIQLAEDSFRAGNLNARIEVERTGALYTMVTAVLKTSDKTAVKGKNYAETSVEVQLMPYQESTVVEIPVAGSDKELSFSVELTDLKGVKAGSRQKADVIIPKTWNKESSGKNFPAVNSEGGEQLAELADGAGATGEGKGDESWKIKTIDIPDKGKCQVEWPSDKKYGVVLDPEMKKLGVKAELGRLYPACEKMENNSLYAFNYADTGNYGPDRGSTEIRRYNDSKGYGELKWYSRRIWATGGCYVTFYLMPARWQSAFLERETLSTFRSCQSVMTLFVDGKFPRTVINNSNVEVSRSLMGPLMMLNPNGPSQGTNNVSSDKPVPSNWNEKEEMKIGVMRNEVGLTEPEMHFWNLLLLNREVHVTLEQPDQMTYRRAGGKSVSEVPCTVSMDSINQVRFLGQSINFQLNPVKTDVGRDSESASGVINGILDSYEITVGEGSEKIIVPSTEGNTLDINEDLMKKIDAKTKKVEKTNYGYYTDITVKPHFIPKYVTVEVLPDDRGSFLDKDLAVQPGGSAKIITRTYKVGDQIDLAAAPANSAVNLFHDTTRVRSYFSYGERNVEQTGNFYLTNTRGTGESQPLMLKDAYYQVKPCFSAGDNYIEIQMTPEARKYLRMDPGSLVTEDEIDREVENRRLSRSLAAQMKNLRILKIKDHAADAPLTRPLTGRAYTLTARPLNESKDSAEGMYRPVWTILQTNRKVHGFSLDMLAQERKEYNRVRLDVEKVDPAEYVDYSVQGHLLFASYSLRSNGQKMTNQPASETDVRAGSRPVLAYDDNGGIVTYYDHRPVGTSDAKGQFTVSGIRAMHGDTISLLISGNGVDQVEYVTLNGKEAGTDERTVSVLQKNDSTGKNDFQEVKLQCYRTTVADRQTEKDTDNIYLPAATPYKPYIATVNYDWTDEYADTRNNQIGIISNKQLNLYFTVIDAKEEKAKQVKYALYNFKGEKKNLKDYTAAYDEASGLWKGEPVKGSSLSPGDQIYAWVVSNKSYTSNGDGTNQGGGKVYWESPPLPTGLSFYERSVEPPRQKFASSLDAKQVGISFPMAGAMAPITDSGFFSWEKTYDNPASMATSGYTNTFAYGLDSREVIKSGRIAISEYVHKDAGKEYLTAAERYAKIRNEFYNDPQNAQKSWGSISDSKSNAYVANKEANKAALEESVGKMNKDAKDKLFDLGLGFKFSMVLYYQYIYNPEAGGGTGRHELIADAMQLDAGATADYSHHFVIPLGPMPGFGRIQGSLLYKHRQIEIYEGAERKTAEQINKYRNLAEVPASQVSQAYNGFGLEGLTLSAGPGFAKGPNIRVFIKINWSYLWPTAATKKKTKIESGQCFEFYGGGELNLILFKISKTWGPASHYSGIYEKEREKKSASVGSALYTSLDDGTELQLRPIGTGSAGGSAPEYEGKGANMEEWSEELLLSGGLEYASPKLLPLEDGQMLLVFLKADEAEGSSANASQLYYCVGQIDDFSGEISGMDPVKIDTKTPDTVDVCPAVLRAGDHVYVAWVSTEKPVTADGSEIEAAIDELGKTNIWLQEFDYDPSNADDPLSTGGRIPLQVTSNRFAVDYLELEEEQGRIVITYRLTDYAAARDKKDLETLVSETANYKTMGRSIYDPELRELLLFKDQSGTVSETEYIVIPHPEMTDPLAIDYTMANFHATDEYGADEYRIEAWITDTDKNLDTDTDKELWARVTNLTEGRSYYPVKLYENITDGVFSPKLTKFPDGDVLLTFLTDDGRFHTFDADDIWGCLCMEDAAGQEQEVVFPKRSDILKMSAESISKPGWYKDLTGIENLLTVRSTVFSDYHGGFTDYQLAGNRNGSRYLFWCAKGDETGVPDRELWGAVYYNDPEDESNERIGWGSPAQLTHTGKCIDETTLAATDSGALLLVANTCTPAYKDEGDPIYNDFELKAYTFQETNSLDLGNFCVYSEPEYPVPGEPFTLYAEVMNTGMMPVKGYTVEVTGMKDGAVVGSLSEEHLDRSDWIFGNEFGKLQFTADWLDTGMVDEVQVRVEETDEDGNILPGETFYGTDQDCAVYRTLDGAAYKFENPWFMDGREAQDCRNECWNWLEADGENGTGKTDEEIREAFKNERFQIAASLMGIGELREKSAKELCSPSGYYVAIVPVTNIGTETGGVLSATAVTQHMKDAEFTEGHTVGTNTESLNRLKPGETAYIAVPVRPDLDDYDSNHTLNIRIDVDENGKKLKADWLQLYIQPVENQTLELNDGVEKIEVRVKDSYQLEAKFFPYQSLGEVYYYSQDPKVASVMPDGKVYGESAGTTTIQAYDLQRHQLWDSVEVTVTGPADDGGKSSGSDSDGSGSSGSSGAGGTMTGSSGPENQAPVMTYGSWEQNADGSWQFRVTAGSGSSSALSGRTADGLATGWHYIRYGGGMAWYHFNSSGIMDTGWYQGAAGTWYYLEESGPGIGVLHTGWHKEQETEKWYYLRASGRDLGRMETGWFLDVNDGRWYWLDPADGGAMAPERTLVGGPELCWPREVEGAWEQRPDGSWSFRLEEGTDFTLTGSAMENGMGPGTGTMGGAVGGMAPDGLAAGWQYIPYEKDGVKGRAWYHFDRTGRMTTGWYQGLNTCWYYLAESGPDIGRLVTGWFTDPSTGKRHYLREDPPDTSRMAVGWYYHLKDRCWYFFDPENGGAMLTGRLNWDGKEWNFDENGRWIP